MKSQIFVKSHKLNIAATEKLLKFWKKHDAFVGENEKASAQLF